LFTWSSFIKDAALWSIWIIH